jgi:hypothetical protein
MIDEIRRRWRDLAVVGAPERMRNSCANAITSPPIAFTER